MVPSGKGADGLFQSARAAEVAPVSVWTCGAADAVVSSRLPELVDNEVEFVASTASGMLAFLATVLVSDDASEAVVVVTSYYISAARQM